jgi:hypothetical protein
LPLTIDMRDHLRQEKTGNLPSPLPAAEREVEFSTGTLGLWSSNHFVIYYRDGRVPQPGIILLGRVTGDVSMFDRPGQVTVRLERMKQIRLSRAQHGNNSCVPFLQSPHPESGVSPCLKALKI